MYACAFRAGGEPLDRTDLFGPATRMRRRDEPTSLSVGPFIAMATESRALRPLLARFGDAWAVGDVRLDNRAELIGLCTRAVPASASDLELVLRILDTYGEAAINRLLGDFAFIVWDARAHKLIAARDAFGVKPLYYRVEAGVLRLASRMDLLADGADYDVAHIADILMGLVSPEDRTIWTGVHPVPAGSCLVQRGTVARGHRFWDATNFAPDAAGDERERVDEFRNLFRDAVRSRLGAPMSTWAQLSGGLDSSSVVATAQRIYGAERLAGTLTLADSLGGGDERRYSDAVVRRFDLRNEQLQDQWAWQDGGTAPPLTDGPRPLYPFFTRDRRSVEIVRNAGGRVILSGFGSDHYLMGHLNYMADMAARGRVGAAVREAARWSIQTRLSFWTMLQDEVVRPLVPARWRRPAADAIPAWIDPHFARRSDIGSRSPDGVASNDPAGELFARRVARDIRSIPAWIDRWPFDDGVEMRYPFLHRPLVEAGLRLPVSMRIRPDSSKWILREAMRGVLPEAVRTRQGKGTIDARILWSLAHERRRIDALLRDPILAQLGCVDPHRLREAVENARHGVVPNLAFLMSALSLETWLSVRAGRWSAPAVAASAA